MTFLYHPAAHPTFVPTLVLVRCAGNANRRCHLTICQRCVTFHCAIDPAAIPLLVQQAGSNIAGVAAASLATLHHYHTPEAKRSMADEGLLGVLVVLLQGSSSSHVHYFGTLLLLALLECPAADDEEEEEHCKVVGELARSLTVKRPANDKRTAGLAVCLRMLASSATVRPLLLGGGTLALLAAALRTSVGAARSAVAATMWVLAAAPETRVELAAVLPYPEFVALLGDKDPAVRREVRY